MSGSTPPSRFCAQDELGDGEQDHAQREGGGRSTPAAVVGQQKRREQREQPQERLDIRVGTGPEQRVDDGNRKRGQTEENGSARNLGPHEMPDGSHRERATAERAFLITNAISRLGALAVDGQTHVEG